MRNRVKVFMVSDADALMAALTLQNLVNTFLEKHYLITEIQYQHSTRGNVTELSCLISYREETH